MGNAIKKKSLITVQKKQLEIFVTSIKKSDWTDFNIQIELHFT